VAVYLLHFGRRLHHAGHYIGTANCLTCRIHQHLCGEGSPLLLHLIMNGITFRCVRVWAGGRNVERYLKSLKCGPKLCPVCNPTALRWAAFDNFGRDSSG